MPNELIINVTVGETRVARLENGVVSEFFIDRANERPVVGNIYKGKVVRVLPGMQAAFVDIGLDRTAFMHASDVVDNLARMEEDVIGTNITDDVKAAISKKHVKSERYIENLLKDGKEIVVQVEKDPMGTKGARVTGHISLPGRYLVYMPTIDHIGISRRIGNDEERDRLKKLIMKIRGASGGFIVRTVSQGVGDRELKADAEFLMKMWKDLEKKEPSVKAPALLREELDLISRVVRDLFTSDIDKVVIDDQDAYERVLDFVNEYMPRQRNVVELYTGSEPIFDALGIEIEITRALGQKVWLKSGGYIIIEQTEALTAIDVNTGRFVGRRNVEDTILKTNLEAVKEIVYQLRLRDIGGIIILDFIDMTRQANRTKVYNTLREALKDDKARTTITKISEIGLVEMTRKRTREDLRRQLTNPCHYCEGKGYLKSPTTVCYEIFRELMREATEIKSKQIVVTCHPNIASVLYDEERNSLEKLEIKLGKRIVVEASPDSHIEQFDIAGK
ncbi:MAG: Rne/Rng family ribonuclease [Pseudomonadota bacterium]